MAAFLAVVLMTVAMLMVEGVVVMVVMLMVEGVVVMVVMLMAIHPLFTLPVMIKFAQLQILRLCLWMQSHGWTNGNANGMVSTFLLLQEVQKALVNTLQYASITSGILGVHAHESVRFSGRPQNIAGKNCVKCVSGV